MQAAISSLQKSADTLLDCNASPGELLTAARELREALGTLAGFDEQVPQATTSTELETGLAISPMDAARCVLDFQRTACFLRGTLAAIEAAINRKAGKVEVLYAGCGPLAPLAVALCHRVENVRFWPVDIHQISVDSVVRLVRNAGYEKRFGEIVVADAAQYQWPQRGEVGIIEVMLRGLENEPQVAVTDNLVRQLVSDGEIVPSAVRLDIQLYDPTTEFDLGGEVVPMRVRVPVAKFLELRADTANELMAGHELELPGACSVPVTRPSQLVSKPSHSPIAPGCTAASTDRKSVV